MEGPNMIAATLGQGITDHGSRAAVDAQDYSGFVSQVSDQAIF
jgi:hypothetical protein